MMIDPPIDELVRKAKGNVYVLSNVVAKRAKEIETLRRVDTSDVEMKSISLACQEVYDGKVVPSDF